jgi:dTDP-glucose 4,6-dehydratase
MKILVTGADGFIGSHLCEKLAQKGHDVKAFVYYNSFNSYGWIDFVNKKIKRKLKIFSGDIRDENLVKKAVKGNDIIIHLAALIGIPYSYNSPQSYYETNVKGTLNILQAAKDLRVKKIIHTSTSEVYGTAKYLPIDEKHPVDGQSPYSASKIAADQMAISFYKSFGTPVSIIRPFNTYGPRQSARAIIPTIILQFLAGKKKINLGSVNTTRDFSYIDDTVNAFVNSITAKKIDGEIINLGAGSEISIKDLVGIIASEMNVKYQIIKDKKRVRPSKSEVNRLLSKNSKAIKKLRWQPKYIGRQGLAKGLKETINWLSKRENFDRYKSNIYNI